MLDNTIVCNTSLNDKGEPIIDTFYGTLAFAIKKNIRIIYADHKRFTLVRDRKKALPGMQREVSFWEYTDGLPRSELIKELNPYNASPNALSVYYNHGRLRDKIRLTDIKNVKYLEKLAKLQAMYMVKEL